MQREILKYLLDIKDSIDSVFEYLGENRDFNEYKSNKLLRRGIERELVCIGIYSPPPDSYRDGGL